MTNVNVTAERLAELGGAANDGKKIGFVNSADKAAQNDTWTVKNASEVLWAVITTDADGVADPVTISSNVITLTSATASSASGYIIFK